MKRKSSKSKKPCKRQLGHGFRLYDIGTFLIGIATAIEVAFKIVIWLLAK